MGLKQPSAVLISDTHYTVSSLPLARSSTEQALRKAEQLGVPLIDCGDILDSKAIIRAECANALIEIFSKAKVPVYLLVGNHTLLNEKSSEHSLHFLKPYCQVIQSYVNDMQLDLHFIPYQSDAQELIKILEGIPTGSTIIAHQGVQTAFMGHYIQDKSSLPPEAFKRFRTISGHYHRHQDIICSEYPLFSALHASKFTYIGTPYTTSFAEAQDGPKGFQILFDDGSLELVPTKLRRHVISECTWDELNQLNPDASKDDLLWLKVKGPYSELQKLKKKDIGLRLLGHSNFKLDLIYTDTPQLELKSEALTNEELFDSIIDNLGESYEQKNKLKNLWREIVCR